jgi:hypothetical protein
MSKERATQQESCGTQCKTCQDMANRSVILDLHPLGFSLENTLKLTDRGSTYIVVKA